MFFRAPFSYGKQKYVIVLLEFKDIHGVSSLAEIRVLEATMVT